MDIITGFTGEAHITSEHDRDINIGFSGADSYVLNNGMKLAAEISSNNEIKIRDGVLIHQGCAASIKKNTYDAVAIGNGSQGMKRIDLIVARYEKNEDSNIESLKIIALQGVPSETSPAIPMYIAGDIQAGDTIVDMPLYKVYLEGLNITSIEPLFNVLMPMSEQQKIIAELNSKSYLRCSIDNPSSPSSVTSSDAEYKLKKTLSKGNAFEISNGRIQVLNDCTVEVCFSLYLTTDWSSGDGLSVSLKKSDGTTLLAMIKHVVYPWEIHSSQHVILQLSAGDELYLTIKNSSASRGNISTVDNYTTLAMKEL